MQYWGMTLMTGPEGNSEFCFPRISKHWDSRDLGKQNSLFPKGPVIKWFVIYQNKTKAKFENHAEIPASTINHSWLTNQSMRIDFVIIYKNMNHKYNPKMFWQRSRPSQKSLESFSSVPEVTTSVARLRSHVARPWTWNLRVQTPAETQGYNQSRYFFRWRS